MIITITLKTNNAMIGAEWSRLANLSDTSLWYRNHMFSARMFLYQTHHFTGYLFRFPHDTEFGRIVYETHVVHCCRFSCGPGQSPVCDGLSSRPVCEAYPENPNMGKGASPVHNSFQLLRTMAAISVTTSTAADNRAVIPILSDSRKCRNVYTSSTPRLKCRLSNLFTIGTSF